MKIEHFVSHVRRVSDVIAWQVQIVPVRPSLVKSVTEEIGFGLSLIAVVALYNSADDSYRPGVVIIDDTVRIVSEDSPDK